jgi:hypothetical protein
MIWRNREAGLFYVNTRCHLLDTRLLEQARGSQTPQGSQLAKEKKNGELGALYVLAVYHAPQVGSCCEPCEGLFVYRDGLLGGGDLRKT